MLHHAFIIHSATISLHAFTDVLHHSSLACMHHMTSGMDSYLTIQTDHYINYYTHSVSDLCCMFACMFVCICLCWVLVSCLGFFLTILGCYFDLLTGHYLNMLLYKDKLLGNLYCEKHYRNVVVNEVMAAVWLWGIVQLQF